MTIGMNNLGKNGRLGNQMFQYAALVGIAKNKGYDFRIPDHSNVERFDYYNGNHIVCEHHQLQHCFEMLHCGNRYGLIDGDEVELHDVHEFCEELYNECPNHVTLSGYFQSEKYFKNAKKLLKWDFRFKEQIVEEVERNYQKYLNEHPVSIVVRNFNSTFDYPGSDNNHCNLSFDYFRKAIEIFGRDRTYIICSNNIELCKQQEIFKGGNFIFNDINPTNCYKAHFDLCLISKCKDFIISNSTFSWWGSWLGSDVDKRVISPDKWYGPGLSNISTKDLIPEEWEIIEA